MSSDPVSYDPPPKPGELAPPVFEIQYLQAYHYVFENPNWFANIAFVALVTLISGFIPVAGPFLGQLVIMGYTFEVVESLSRTMGRRYPDFTFDRLTDYLVRGLWPFLASLVASLVIIPVGGGVGLAIFGMWGGFAAGNANGAFGNADPSPILIAISVILGAGVLFFAWLFSLLVVVPMTLRAGLSQEIGEAFKFAWISDFASKIWFEAILMSLFLAASGLGVLIVGLLMACVGYYFAIGLVSLAQAHLSYQLYQLYLTRGGEPIPLKMPPVLAVAPPGGHPFGPPAGTIGPFGPNAPPK